MQSYNQSRSPVHTECKLMVRAEGAWVSGAIKCAQTENEAEVRGDTDVKV